MIRKLTFGNVKLKININRVKIMFQWSVVLFNLNAFLISATLMNIEWEKVITFDVLAATYLWQYDKDET